MQSNACYGKDTRVSLSACATTVIISPTRPPTAGGIVHPQWDKVNLYLVGHPGRPPLGLALLQRPLDPSDRLGHP